MVKSGKLLSMILALMLSLMVATAALAQDATATPDAQQQQDNDNSDDAAPVQGGQQGTQPAVGDPNQQQQGGFQQGGQMQEGQQGAQQQAPGTLPQTGGVTTPWANIALMLAGGLVLAGGLGLALARRFR